MLGNSFGKNADVIFISTGRSLPYKDIGDYLIHNGKWIIYSPREKMLGLVATAIQTGLFEREAILGGKYTTKPAFDVPEGHKLGIDYAFMLYCSNSEKLTTAKMISGVLGLKEKYLHWKNDLDTLREMKVRGEKLPEGFEEIMTRYNF